MTYLGNEIRDIEHSDQNDRHPVPYGAVLDLRDEAGEHQQCDEETAKRSNNQLPDLLHDGQP